MTTALRELLDTGPRTRSGYAFAYMDESAKREVRRALLKGVCIPGHLVPFASREMPVARGWGSGGFRSPSRRSRRKTSSRSSTRATTRA